MEDLRKYISDRSRLNTTEELLEQIYSKSINDSLRDLRSGNMDLNFGIDVSYSFMNQIVADYEMFDYLSVPPDIAGRNMPDDQINSILYAFFNCFYEINSFNVYLHHHTSSSVFDNILYCNYHKKDLMENEEFPEWIIKGYEWLYDWALEESGVPEGMLVADKEDNIKNRDEYGHNTDPEYDDDSLGSVMIIEFQKNQYSSWMKDFMLNALDFELAYEGPDYDVFAIACAFDYDGQSYFELRIEDLRFAMLDELKNIESKRRKTKAVSDAVNALCESVYEKTKWNDFIWLLRNVHHTETEILL